MAETELTVYGTQGCPDVRWSRKYLDENGIPYRWVDINQDAEGLKFVQAVNDGNRSVPTIVFEDGEILVEPSNAELAGKLRAKPVATSPRSALGRLGDKLRRNIEGS